MKFVFSMVVAAGVFCAGGVVVGQGEAAQEDWLENYYKKPTPERFVAEMKKYAGEGLFKNDNVRPVLIAFISQVIRQNRDQVDSWYDGLSALSPEEKSTLHTGMLFSRTKNADELMKKRFGAKYVNQKADTPKILEMPLDKTETLDMLWGYFYATGSESAIRRMVIAFRFVEAPERPEGVDVPEGFVPLYKELPQIFADSIVANAERHPRVIEILKKLEKDETLLPIEKTWVSDILKVL